METLNTQVQPFFEWLLRTTLQASLMVCLILLIQRILRSKLGIRWHYSLWLLLLVRMSLPWAPQSNASMFNLIPQSVYQQQIEYVQPETNEQLVGSDVTSSVPVKTVPASPVVTTHKSPDAVSATSTINQNVQNQLKPDFSRILKNLPILWLTGALVLAVYVCTGNFNLWRIVKSRRPLIDQKILELLEDCKSQMGIQTILGIVTTDKVKSPALFGFIRPRLLLPAGMLDNLSSEELRFVFLHELAHLKRRDIYIGWFISVLQVLHWFNPLVWLAFRRMRADRELACDALVLDRSSSDEPKSYGQIIVSLLERFSRPRFMPGMAGILETKSQLKRRITMIAKFKKNSYQWSPLAVILTIILACISLPDATRTKASQTSSTEPTPKIALRRIEVRGRGSVHSRPSFNGKYMLGVDKETGNITVRELDTGIERVLTKNSDPNRFVHGSLISRDSKKVAFYHYNPEKEDFDLRIVGIDGSDLRTLLGAEIAGCFNMDAWSPDGKYIFGKLMKKPVQLVQLSADNGSIEVLKTFDQGGAFNIDVSADGRYLAYSRAEQKNSKPDIFVFDLEQNIVAPLATHPAADKLLGWTPDGQHVFFTSDRNGTWDGWLLRVVNGKPDGLPEVVKPGIGNVSPLGFTHSGSFYYAFQHQVWNVYTATLDSDTGEIISDPKPVRDVGSDIRPDWSPDGRYLAYCSQLDRDKPQIIRIRTLATGKERQLKTELPYFDWLRWCPDSRHLLITNFNRGSLSVVYKLDVQTGEHTALVQSDEQRIRQAELSADGKTLAYRIRGSGNANRLIVRDMETGREKELLRSESVGAAPLLFWALSPDGKHVALSIVELSIGEGQMNRAFVLKIISVASGEARTVVGDSVGELAWTSDGHDLLFVKGFKELWRVSAEGGEPRKLWEWKQMQMLWGLRIHPDGQRFAFFSGGNVSEMWVMENFLPKTVAVTRK